MKARFITFIFAVVISLEVAAQGVGINVDTPQAVLHVGGGVRIDSLPATSQLVKIVGSDSLGNLQTLIPKDLLSTVSTNSFVFGETIQQGDVVAMGDGMTGYLAADQQNSPYTALSVAMGDWVGQSFTTSARAVGIKMIRFRASGLNQMMFTARIRRCVNGLPVGPDLGTATYSHSGANTAILFLMVFNPPVPVMPNTQYAFLVDYQKPATPTNNFYYSNANYYPQGVRLHSSNAGASWTTYPNQDLVFTLFETQTQPGQVYRSRTFDNSSILDGAKTDSYSSIDAAHFGIGDRLDNTVGVAFESGVAGQSKRVFIGYPCDGFSGLLPARTYYLDTVPGQVSLYPPSGQIVKTLGFSLDNHRMVLQH